MRGTHEMKNRVIGVRQVLDNLFYFVTILALLWLEWPRWITLPLTVLMILGVLLSVFCLLLYAYLLFADKHEEPLQ